MALTNVNIPRTVIVDVSDNFGGANARVLALMKRFPTDKIGLATINASRIAPELEKLGYRVHRLADNKFDPRIPFRLAHVIREVGYQVLDTQNPNSKLWGSMAALLCGIPLVSTLNSWYMNEHPRYSLRWFVYSALELVTNFSLSRYIVVSREIQQDMMRIGVPEEKIDLIYNAVDIDATNMFDSREDLLDKYHFPRNAIVCLAAGRLVWAKAHDDLVSAISLARQNNPNLCCLIAGEGILFEKLQKQISDMGLIGSVVLAGHLDHAVLLSTLKSCDIYVMPSRTEGTPVALLEAAMLSKPIVASRVGGIPELVNDEEQALLFEKGDVDSLSNKILRLANDADAAFQLGARARRHVVSSFALDDQVQATINAYNRALEKSKFHNKKKI